MRPTSSNEPARQVADGAVAPTQPSLPQKSRARLFITPAAAVRFEMGRELLALHGQLVGLRTDTLLPENCGLVTRARGVIELIAEEAYAVGNDRYSDAMFQASVEELCRQLGTVAEPIATVARPHCSRLAALGERLGAAGRQRH